MQARPPLAPAGWEKEGGGGAEMEFVVLPGDGIGPEITDATIQVLEVLNYKLNLGITFKTHEIGLSRLAKGGSTFPDEVLEAARAADGIICKRRSNSGSPALLVQLRTWRAWVRVWHDTYF